MTASWNWRDEAVAQPRLDEPQRDGGVRRPTGPSAGRGCRRRARPCPGWPSDDGRVARAGQLLELGLGGGQRAGGDVGGLGAELERLVGVERAQADLARSSSVASDAVRLT